MGKPTAAQLELARSLGVTVTEGMTTVQLRSAISAAPATAAQRDFVGLVLTYLKQDIPDNMTFGQARRVLDELLPLTNDIVLREQNWEAGDILAWRDGYYRIASVQILTYVLWLKRVEIEPGQPGEPAVVVETIEPMEHHNPFTLRDEATKIDLLNWRP